MSCQQIAIDLFDFNIVMNPNIDCKLHKDENVTNPNTRNTMLKTMNNLDIFIERGGVLERDW